jgi:MOSC domain-containing protein YiiM
MKIISVNVGLPRSVRSGDRDVITGIFKSAVAGPRMLRRLNLEGDGQADLENHGGVAKAVYAYPSEHYEFWRKELPGMELPPGIFGENLTTEGLREEDAGIGDHYRIGRAVVMVRQPRIPCYKLGVRFGRDDIAKRFLASGRCGIYFSVEEEGLVAAGDAIERIQRGGHGLTIADIERAYVHGRDDVALMRRIVSLKIMPAGLHDDFVQKLAALEA